MEGKVLLKLRENPDNFVSGEKLSEYLGVSRTAVWKYINNLKKEGYIIEASSKKGYRLVSGQDILNEYEIGYNLDTRIMGKRIYCLSSVDSTNNYAKKLAFEGAEEGTLVLADFQTSGKGRLGKSWASANKKGIWMTVILRPKIPPEEVHIITLAAAVAVVKALEGSTGISAGIKWPNDIILDNRKVCGILTEMTCEMEAVNYIVLGMGINVNQSYEDFPCEIRETAVSIKEYMIKKDMKFSREFLRNEIIQKILFELEQIYIKISNGDFTDIIDEWKKYSVTLGKEVRAISKSNTFTGIAKDITKDGRLIVDCTDGVTREVFYGEVSVRGILDYV